MQLQDVGRSCSEEEGRRAREEGAEVAREGLQSFQVFSPPGSSKLQERSKPSLLRVSPILRNFIEDDMQRTESARVFHFGASSRALGRPLALGKSKRTMLEELEETKDKIAEKMQRDLGISDHKMQVALEEFERKRMELSASLPNWGDTPILLLAGDAKQREETERRGEEVNVGWRVRRRKGGRG